MPTSPPIQLADVIALNQHIKIFTDAGLPMDFGAPAISESLAESLERIVSSLAVPLAQGTSIEKTLETDKSIPRAYCLALENWTKGITVRQPLAPIHDVAVRHEESRSQLKFSLLHPLFILMLVYGGFVHLTLVIEPKLVAIYSQLQEPPGPWLSILSWLRMTFPVWSIAIPVLIAFAYFCLRRKTMVDQVQNLVPRSKESRLLYLTNYAQSAALLVQEGHEVEEALKRSRGICSDDSSAAKKQVLAPELDPLTKWAVSQNDSPRSQASALMFASQAYQESLRMHSQRFQRWLPICLTAILGGAMVLAFALGIFAPMIELLFTLVRG